MMSLQIYGWGMHTALGNAKSTLLSLRLGQSGFTEHPRWVDTHGGRFTLALSPELDPVLPVAERLFKLVEQALNDTLQTVSAEALNQAGHRLTLLLVLPPLQTGITQADYARFGKLLNQALQQGGWPVRQILAVYGGHCAAADALGQTTNLLSNGESTLCLIGAVDSWANPPRLERLDANGLLHRENQRGFIPGEAAAFCLLGLDNGQEALAGETNQPLVRQVAIYDDPFRVGTEDTPTGNALAKACQQVLQTLPEKKQIQQVYADFNGERWRATEYGLSSLRIAPWLSRTDQFTPLATGIGDVGTATGLSQVIHAVTAAHKGFHPGRHSLLWQADADGKRSAILLKLPQKIPQLRQ